MAGLLLVVHELKRASQADLKALRHSRAPGSLLCGVMFAVMRLLRGERTVIIQGLTGATSQAHLENTAQSIGDRVWRTQRPTYPVTAVPTIVGMQFVGPANYKLQE